MIHNIPGICLFLTASENKNALFNVHLSLKLDLIFLNGIYSDSESRLHFEQACRILETF